MAQIRVICPICEDLEIWTIAGSYLQEKCYDAWCWTLYNKKRQYKAYKIVLNRIDCLACDCTSKRVLPTKRWK